MRGILRNIAILLALSTLAVTGVAGTAEAKGGGKLGAAAAKMSRGAQIRLNRMTQKLSMSARGIQKQKPRRQLRLGKKQLMRAMGRRDVGLHGSEVKRTRQRFARDADQPGGVEAEQHEEFGDFTEDHRGRASGADQGKKMRDRAKRRAVDDHRKKLRRN
jgi:hypothetical protein